MGTNPTITEKRKIKVKITGDGTCISRNMHAILKAFTLIEDEASPNSPRGNHSIALLNAEENYGDLAESLKEIPSEIKGLKSVKVNDTEYELNISLERIGNFLLSVGIEAANAKYSCIWCTCPSDE